MCKNKEKPQKDPDGRGERPKDPNQLALWIVEQSTTTQNNAKLCKTLQNNAKHSITKQSTNDDSK